MNTATTLGVGSAALYLVATALVGVRLAFGHQAVGPSRNALLGVAFLAIGLHGALLYNAILTDVGLNLGLVNAASLIAWVIALLLILAAFNQSLETLGVFVLPLAAATIVLALAYPTDRLLAHEAGVGVELHIVFSIVAAGVLTIAAFQAVLLAFQEQRLRNKRPGGVLRLLPALQSQETLLFRMIEVGFFLLSLSLVTGVMFLEDILAQHLVHKTVLSLLAWTVFAVLLWGRWRRGWRGQTATRWSLAGFFSLMLAYFGSKLVLELILGRAWY
jgi:ABC-type uncharacterized transport system permease subunit